jgi:putative hemolysin
VLQLLATTTRENKLEGGYKKLQHSQAGGGMVTRCKLKDGNKPTRESERYNRGTSRRVCGKEESRNLLTCFFSIASSRILAFHAQARSCVGQKP